MDADASQTTGAQRRFNRFVVGLAAAIGLDGLLLVPVLFAVNSWPDLLWQALVIYVAATLAVLAIVGLLMFRTGILVAAGPWAPGMAKLAGLAALIVAGLALGVFLAPPLLLVLVLAYLWALAYAAYATMKWQAVDVIVRCSDCQAVESVAAGAWLSAPAEGGRRRVACQGCGAQTWGTLERAVSRGK